MGNILKALKELYVAVDGSDPGKISGVKSAVNAIAEQLGGDGDAKLLSEAIKDLTAVMPDPKAETMLAGIIDRSITEVSNSEVTSIGSYAFSGCTSLASADFPEATSIGSAAFSGCTALETITVPKVTSVDPGNYGSLSGAFAGCTSLVSADFPEITSISKNMFYACTSLETLILRKNEVATLDSGALAGTKIDSRTGYIYVPDDLVDSYKSAQNWSTYAAQIKGLSELPTNTETV